MNLLKFKLSLFLKFMRRIFISKRKKTILSLLCIKRAFSCKNLQGANISKSLPIIAPLLTKKYLQLINAVETYNVLIGLL